MTAGQSASLSCNKAPTWGLRLDFYSCQTLAALLMRGVLSDERTGLYFTTAAGPRQRSHSRGRVPWDSRPYFTVSDSRPPFSSPPTISRATVEVFDPASTRGFSSQNPQNPLVMAVRFTASARTSQRTPFPRVLILLRSCLLRPLPSNIRFLQSHYLATAIV
jgi:hypothetical protein